MDIFETFATNEQLETEGKWFPLSKTARVKVARSGNPRYLAMLRDEAREAQLDMASGEEANELAEELVTKTMAKTILLGWEGVTKGGEPVVYSNEAALEYLKLKDFRRKIQAFSDNMEAFRLKSEAEQGKD